MTLGHVNREGRGTGATALWYHVVMSHRKPGSPKIKKFTLRLPKELYERSRKLARRRRVSMNELARTGLEQLTAAEEFEKLKAAYDELGSDPESNVDVYFAAQREVVLGDE
jgi:hypothetical protein